MAGDNEEGGRVSEPKVAHIPNQVVILWLQPATIITYSSSGGYIQRWLVKIRVYRCANKAPPCKQR